MEEQVVDKLKLKRKNLTRGEFIGASVAGVAGLIAGFYYEPLKAAAEDEALSNFKIEFAFTPHYDKKDASQIEQQIKSSDILFLEFSGHNSSMQKFLDKVSLNQVSENEINEFCKTVNFPDFLAEILTIVKGSKKLVDFLDITDDDPLLVANELIEWKNQLNYDGSFDEAISTQANFNSEYATWVRMREDLVSKKLKQKLLDIKLKYPFMPADPKVLICFGAIHTRLKHQIAKDGVDVKSTFPLPYFTYSHRDENIRRSIFRDDVNRPNNNISIPNKENLAKQLLENLFFRSDLIEDYITKFNNASLFIKWLRKTIDRFSLDEIKDIWEWQIEARATHNRNVLDGRGDLNPAITKDQKEMQYRNLSHQEFLPDIANRLKDIFAIKGIDI